MDPLIPDVHGEPWLIATGEIPPQLGAGGSVFDYLASYEDDAGLVGLAENYNDRDADD